jgi:hypothetical protein
MKFTNSFFALAVCSTAFANISPVQHRRALHRRQGTITVPPLTSQNAPATYQAQCEAASSKISTQAITNDIANVTSNSLAIQVLFSLLSRLCHTHMDTYSLNSTLFWPNSHSSTARTLIPVNLLPCGKTCPR